MVTKEELIKRIEAGEVGYNVDIEVDKFVSHKAMLMPSYTTNLNAAKLLLEGYEWRASETGLASVWKDSTSVRYETYVRLQPAAALVASWLKSLS